MKEQKKETTQITKQGKATVKGIIGIRSLVLLPMIILGTVTIISCAASVHSLRSVNKNATTISNQCMDSLMKLSDIESNVQNIHRMALSHIIATKFDTMVEIVENVEELQGTLDTQLEEYKVYVNEENVEHYDSIVNSTRNNRKRS